MFRLLGPAFYAFHPASIRAYLQNKHREGIDQLRADIYRSSNAGVFLFAPLIENEKILRIINPIHERERANKYFLTLLALKLIGKKRRYDINFMLEDAGLALFTGSSTVLCSTSLHSFDYDMKEATLIINIIRYFDFCYPFYPLVSPFTLCYELKREPPLWRKNIIHFVRHYDFIFQNIIKWKRRCIAIIRLIC